MTALPDVNLLKRGSTTRLCFVVGAGEPRNAPPDPMHGFLSRDGTPPAEFLAAGRREVAGHGGEVMSGTVTDLVPEDRHAFWVFLADGQRQITPRLARRSSRARLTYTHQQSSR